MRYLLALWLALTGQDWLAADWNSDGEVLIACIAADAPAPANADVILLLVEDNATAITERAVTLAGHGYQVAASGGTPQAVAQLVETGIPVVDPARHGTTCAHTR